MKTSEKREKKQRQLAAEERETLCVMSDSDSEWVITTASPKYKNKFAKLGWKYTDVDCVYGYVKFVVPERCVTFRKLEKKKVSQATVDALQLARLSRKSLNTTSDLEVNNAKP